MSEAVNSSLAQKESSSLAQKESSSLTGLQRRLERFDADRGWDAVSPAHTALHLIEELGEVMREALHLEGYKQPDPEARERLGGELADVTLLLFKLASQYGVDLERVVLEKMTANDLRFPLEASKAAMRVYTEQQGLEMQNLEMQSLEQPNLEKQNLEKQNGQQPTLERLE